MTAQLIDGKLIAQQVLDEVAAIVAKRTSSWVALAGRYHYCGYWQNRNSARRLDQARRGDH